MAEPRFPRGVAIVDAVKLAPKVANAHERLRAVLEKVLSAKGWTVVQVATDEDCDGDCMARLADQAGADYVLRLTGDRNEDDGYDVVIEVRGAGATELHRTDAYCDYCTVERMADVAGRTASEMLASAASEEETSKKNEKPSPAPSPPAPALPAPAPAPAPAPLPSPVLVTPTAAQSSVPVWIPWTLIGAGAIILGYGGWALHQDGRATGTCSPSQTTTCEHYSSRTVGIVALVGGGLLATAGVVWEITRLTYETSISLSPNHIALNVRF